MKVILKSRRISQMDLGEVYFWTDTIKDWKYLLKQDKYKEIIINSLRNLWQNELINIYAFVIMPNHLHLIWKLNKLNGKEKPSASFNKETSHLIMKDLKANHPKVLPYFREQTKERSYRIWQRDPMAIKLDSTQKFEQKLRYIHNNPLVEKWNLAKSPESYHWSSASFYETGKCNFGFIEDYRSYL